MIPFSELNAPTRLYISGEYLDAAGGGTFETLNPATGELLGQVARGSADDIDQAVRAARAAMDAGDWPKMASHDRERLLHRIADLIEQNAETLAVLETYDTGKPYKDALRIDIPLTVQSFRYYAGWPSKLRGDTLPVRGNFLTYTPVSYTHLTLPTIYSV